VAAQILQRFTGIAEEIANDARVGEVKVLNPADSVPEPLAAPPPGPQPDEPPAARAGQQYRG
jgi:hypothetical protein